MYLLGMDEKENDDDIVMVSFKAPKKLRDSFHAAANVENMDASNLFRQFMNKTIREVKGRDAEAFERALSKERQRASKNKSAKIERTRGLGQLMEVPKSEFADTVFDLEEIYQRVLAQGFDTDYITVQATIAGKAPDVDEDLKKAILTAAGILKDEEYPKLKSNGA
jgi:hypothetical protein